ncbi:methyltransferase domain-containing protein [Catellatospora citrea]|uniref:class I SAM-dependent methyltransferase n=1 Tax=Catellatospora citrea TaxID=53366 RepID=UPI0033E257FB
MTDGVICDAVAGHFASYLSRALPLNHLASIRHHLDGCDTCWSEWNRYRWDAASGHPLVAELRRFMGPRFRPYFDSSRALQAEWLAAAPTTAEQRREFFGSTESYIYNLVVWHASGNRPPYVEAANAHLPAGSRIIDFGAGIGQDAIDLARQGHQVVACEIEGPSSDFLRWRLREHGLQIEVCAPQTARFSSVDTLWIIDTLDHLLDIDAVLGEVLEIVDRVICENLHSTRSGGQSFHERRSLSAVAKILSRYRLVPQPVLSNHPLMSFVRPHSA